MEQENVFPFTEEFSELVLCDIKNSILHVCMYVCASVW